VLVNNRPITEYPHLGKVYVEGRAGSEYQIEVRNNSYQRIEAVISVDGLSVLDGKPAGMQSSGYVVKAYETLRVPGWTLDNKTVAKFGFAGKDGSYASQMTGDTRNNGVIGVMVFREKIHWKTYTPTTLYTSSPSYTSGVQWGANYPSTMNLSATSMSANAASDFAATGMATASVAPTSDSVSQSLGTAFGDATGFATTCVTFMRADGAPVILTLYYDERRGLKARGIKIGRPFKAEAQPLPQAFPAGIGCSPPPNWRG
jgi:hypothetical protein